jgi:hypothetical protein
MHGHNVMAAAWIAADERTTGELEAGTTNISQGLVAVYRVYVVRPCPADRMATLPHARMHALPRCNIKSCASSNIIGGGRRGSGVRFRVRAHPLCPGRGGGVQGPAAAGLSQGRRALAAARSGMATWRRGQQRRVAAWIRLEASARRS